MKHNTKKFTFTAKWYPYVGKLLLEGRGDTRSIYVSPFWDTCACQVGANLSKWLGKKRRKVTITVSK